MRSLVPFPLLALALFGMWVLLTGFSPGHILLGAVIALSVSRVMRALQPEPPRIRFSMAIIRLAGIVLADIIRSNIAVGRIVLFSPHERRSGFIQIPLQLRSSYGLAVLAIIITATPGTIWLQHDAQRGQVLIHVLDVVDEQTWIDLIKNRYEQLLMEIFE